MSKFIAIENLMLVVWVDSETFQVLVQSVAKQTKLSLKLASTGWGWRTSKSEFLRNVEFLECLVLLQ
jgi:hypothetical protein